MQRAFAIFGITAISGDVLAFVKLAR